MQYPSLRNKIFKYLYEKLTRRSMPHLCRRCRAPTFIPADPPTRKTAQAKNPNPDGYYR